MDAERMLWKSIFVCCLTAMATASYAHAQPAMLFLPPYSPDFNPIEMAFSKLKALLRKAEERTIEGLWSAIGRLADTITPDQCANFVSADGYEPV
jgi:transposase